MYGVLKEIEFTKIELSNTPGELIPNGVEILTYSPFYGIKTNKTNIKIKTTPFSTLPSSLNTINNAIIILPSSSIGEMSSSSSSNLDYIIPNNIKSISIINLPAISRGKDEDINKAYLKIPNSLESLEFMKLNIYKGFNQGVKLVKGDIPEGIKKLSILGYKLRNNEIDILPNSIKELSISIGKNPNLEINLSNLNQLEILKIKLYRRRSYLISPISNLTKFKNLKKLTIILSNYTTIENDSLPINLDELVLHKLNKYGKLSTNFIPNSVTKLTISPELLKKKYKTFEIKKDVKLKKNQKPFNYKEFN